MKIIQVEQFINRNDSFLIIMNKKNEIKRLFKNVSVLPSNNLVKTIPFD